MVNLSSQANSQGRKLGNKVNSQEAKAVKKKTVHKNGRKEKLKKEKAAGLKKNGEKGRKKKEDE